MLRGKPIEVVKGETVDLPVPATAEIVIEGEVDAMALKEEGPFGEYTGYYSGLVSVKRPFTKVNCVTYGDNPVFWHTSLDARMTHRYQ